MDCFILIKQLEKYGCVIINEDYHGTRWKDFANRFMNMIDKNKIITEWYKDSVLVKKIG